MYEDCANTVAYHLLNILSSITYYYLLTYFVVIILKTNQFVLLQE